MPGDGVDSLSARILEQEHELLVDVIGRLGQQMNEHANEHANERVNARVGEQVGGKTGGKTGRKIGEGRCARRGQEQA
jgi:hypothetical protein